MVPRPLAPTRAIKFRTCAVVLQPCRQPTETYSPADLFSHGSRSSTSRSDLLKLPNYAERRWELAANYCVYSCFEKDCRTKPYATMWKGTMGNGGSGSSIEVFQRHREKKPKQMYTCLLFLPIIPMDIVGYAPFTLLWDNLWPNSCILIQQIFLSLSFVSARNTSILYNESQTYVLYFFSTDEGSRFMCHGYVWHIVSFQLVILK